MPAATSSAVTSRPIGCRAFSAARSAAGSSAWSSSRPTHGVSAVPGLTQFTLMPSWMWSAAIASVSDSTAPLVAEYTARCGSPATAAIEQVLTIAACSEARRYGSAARVTRTRPTTLTSNTRCHSSSGLSATVPIEPMPALFTRMSTPPRRPAAVSTASRTDASSVTSAATPVNSSPGLRSSTATCAPRLARSRAVASPIPEPPPVTIAVSPLSSAMSYLPLVYRPSRPPAPRPGSGGRDEALLRPAQAVDLQPHLVARTQVGVVGQAERDPGRGAGVDQVARLEHHVLAQVPDEVRDPEDHGARGPILPLAPVDREPQPQKLRVGHFVGGDQPRPQRVERLARFAEVPLRRQVELEGPFRHVVADCVARDAGQRFLGRAEVAGGGADDDAQFDFPVGPLRAARYPHVVIRPGHGGRVLHEHHRTLRYRGAR